MSSSGSAKRRSEMRSTADAHAPRGKAELASNSTSGLQFVNITKPNHIKDTKTQKLIRRAAAQNSRKRSVLEKAQEIVLKHKSCSLSDEELCKLASCPECGLPLAQDGNRPNTGGETVKLLWPQSTNQTSLVPTLGAGRSDPFLAFPIPMRPYMNVLIDHCQQLNCTSEYILTVSRC
jgi:hypothetical protein